MFHKCHLVHADLSEYNMLWHDGRIYFIDLGQSVEPWHPKGLEFLFRDCCNVCNFFNKTRQVDDVMTPQQLFNHVSGFGVYADTDHEFLIQVSTSSVSHMTSSVSHMTSCCTALRDMTALFFSPVEEPQTKREVGGSHSLKN